MATEPRVGDRVEIVRLVEGTRIKQLGTIAAVTPTADGYALTFDPPVDQPSFG